MVRRESEVRCRENAVGLGALVEISWSVVATSHVCAIRHRRLARFCVTRRGRLGFRRGGYRHVEFVEYTYA